MLFVEITKREQTFLTLCVGKWFLVFVLQFFLFGVKASAVESQPVLQRRSPYYTIDPADPFAPVEKLKKPSRSMDCCLMRDPSREKLEAKDSSTSPSKNSNKQQLKFIPRAHRFSEVVVKGEVKKPRVKFERPIVPLKPIEESLPMDEFLQRSSY